MAQSPQAKPFSVGAIEHLQSKELGEDRILNIFFPAGYERDTASYPVVYVLDGSANEDFVHTGGLVQYMSMYQLMPASIVVGIANVDRKRDYTFPSKNKEDLKLEPTSGGSAKFIAFIEKELQPFIQKNYRTNEEKTLIGQSLGGLVATEILLKKPTLFNDYLIVSPSLWWDDESLLRDAPALLKNMPAGRRVYVSVGTEGKQMEGDAMQLADLLKESKKAQTFFITFPSETHLTILHRALYKGFELMNGK